jgi:SAM-dependent methyltransferase
VTNERDHPREGMSDKFRQIQKFAEIIAHLVEESFPVSRKSSASAPTTTPPETAPLRVVDMGAGKGYLTFAIAEMMRQRARVVGIEARGELVDFCNRIASEQNFSDFLHFSAGTIESTDVQSLDLLIALHACDTATDDALAKGITAGAKLLVVSPCCQKELRRQLTPPRVLESALQHGIFQERQAEFVTDALRAQLLEWAGYQTRVFEFISTEHTAKNLMITAVKSADRPRQEFAPGIREFAAFYGIKSQRLAAHLGFELTKNSAFDSAPPR